MSKIGQRKIIIPEEVEFKIEGKKVKVSGPKGELALEIPENIEISQEPASPPGKGNLVQVSRLRHGKFTRSLHGLYRKLIANMVEGVNTGFEKKLDFKGVGYRAEVQQDTLILQVGFSHPVEVKAPEGISLKVEKNIITVSGIDRQKVGQVAAQIRSVRPVEPYKGKGIKYLDEIPRRKPGKAAKAIVGGAG